MNRIIKFFHEFTHPHCPDCRAEKEDTKVCNNCEILKHQLEMANLQIDKLVNKIADKPEPAPTIQIPPQLTRPRMIPWKVKQQMLEAEDRAKAASIKNAGQPDKTDVTELEKELYLAETIRDGTNAKPS